jgi:hypothetical protein
MAVSDGYWLDLAPLPQGAYVLDFGGTAFADTPSQLSVDITDTITLQLRGQSAPRTGSPARRWSKRRNVWAGGGLREGVSARSLIRCEPSRSRRRP